ncbi:MAG: ribonuclease P protein component [Burkholderiaceae bacterium]|nr:ribonuclease P protein component [Burkholderiaceae bacterium]
MQTRAGGRFSRKRRIVNQDDFSSVFRAGCRHRTAHFALYAGKGKTTCARLGVVVARRLAKQAVVRNSIRRVCRELFRGMVLPVPIDCVVRLSRSLEGGNGRTSGTMFRRQVREELGGLFSRLARKERRQ